MIKLDDETVEKVYLILFCTSFFCALVIAYAEYDYSSHLCVNFCNLTGRFKLVQASAVPGPFSCACQIITENNAGPTLVGGLPMQNLSSTLLQNRS